MADSRQSCRHCIATTHSLATLLHPVSEHTSRPDFAQQAVQAVRPDLEKPAHLQCAAVAGTDLACKPVGLWLRSAPWAWLSSCSRLCESLEPCWIECGVTTIWIPYLPLSLPPAFTHPRISIGDTALLWLLFLKSDTQPRIVICDCTLSGPSGTQWDKVGSGS